jgi:hypothetical protein
MFLSAGPVREISEVDERPSGCFSMSVSVLNSALCSQAAGYREFYHRLLLRRCSGGDWGCRTISASRWCKSLFICHA